MEFPVCPGCGSSRWESVENYGGGSKRYELRAAGWLLVDDWLDLLETDYLCRDCGYDPAADGEDDLWEVLNDIETAHVDVPDPTRVGVQALTLWGDDRSAA
jgi:hypothetical protein